MVLCSRRREDEIAEFLPSLVADLGRGERGEFTVLGVWKPVLCEEGYGTA